MSGKIYIIFIPLSPSVIFGLYNFAGAGRGLQCHTIALVFS